MKKLLLLVFCVITISGSELNKYVFDLQNPNHPNHEGIVFLSKYKNSVNSNTNRSIFKISDIITNVQQDNQKYNLLKKCGNCAQIDHDLIYRLALIKYGGDSNSELGKDSKKLYWNQKISYKYECNQTIESSNKPLIENFSILENDKETNDFILYQKNSNLNYKIEIKLDEGTFNCSTKEIITHKIIQIIITKTIKPKKINTWLYPSIKWSAIIGASGLTIYGIYYKWFKK